MLKIDVSDFFWTTPGHSVSQTHDFSEGRVTYLDSIKIFKLFFVMQSKDIFIYHTTFSNEYFIKSKGEFASFTQNIY